MQGAELKGELKEDSIFWDDGDVWVRDATSDANGYSQGFVPTQDPATGRSTKRAQKGAGKGKHSHSHTATQPHQSNSHTATQPHSHTATQPPSHTVTQPPSHPAAQPPSHTAT